MSIPIYSYQVISTKCTSSCSNRCTHLMSCSPPALSAVTHPAAVAWHRSTDRWGLGGRLARSRTASSRQARGQQQWGTGEWTGSVLYVRIERCVTRSTKTKRSVLWTYVPVHSYSCYCSCEVSIELYHPLISRLGTSMALPFAIFIGWECLSRHWVGFP